MIEIWKDIPEYEGLYQVSNLGRVKSLPRNMLLPDGKICLSKEKILKNNVDKDGYLIICLSKNNSKKTYRVHRLVASTFIANIDNKLTVNHIDGNKQNNNVNNLEWATNKEQTQHALNNNLIKKGRYNKFSKKVYQYDLNNKLIKIWDSLSSIKKNTKMETVNISRCCRNFYGYKTAYGYIWKYEEV